MLHLFLFVLFLCMCVACASPMCSMHADADVFLKLEKLASQPNFTLLGLAANACGARCGGSKYEPSSTDSLEVHFVYVHAKLAIVDDQWFTIGSANQVDISMHRDHTEVNASVWDAPTARALRSQLVEEHSGVDTSAMEGARAMDALVTAARRNASRVSSAGPVSEQGVWSTTKPSELLCHAFPMDLCTYGL